MKFVIYCYLYIVMFGGNGDVFFVGGCNVKWKFWFLNVIGNGFGFIGDIVVFFKF